MPGVPPRLVAAVDQRRAHIADLVRQVRQHQDHCHTPGLCPGDDVLQQVHRLNGESARRLAVSCLVELARANYPEEVE